MRTAPEWAIQASWSVSGLFATGALWYFLSVQSYWWAGTAATCALAFGLLAVRLHHIKDAASTAAPESMTESPAAQFARRYADQPSHIRFIQVLPKLQAAMYESAQQGWDTGVTLEMREASYDVIDFLEFAWLRIAEFYPPRHFGGVDAQAFIRDYIRKRFAYHWAKHEPEGPGSGGTITGVLTGGDVISDLEKMIADAVFSLFGHQDGFDFQDWYARWRRREPYAPSESSPP